MSPKISNLSTFEFIIVSFTPTTVFTFLIIIKILILVVLYYLLFEIFYKKNVFKLIDSIIIDHNEIGTKYLNTINTYS